MMKNGRRIRTTVLPGGRIEILAPDLPVGGEVEVTLEPAPAKTGQRSALEIMAEAPGQRLFKTAEDVDAYIRDERDSWDR